MTIRNSFPDVRPALNLDFANTKRLDPRITFTRSSTGTYVDEFGVIKTAASNEARFDHDSSGNSLGLLIEESRTNLVTYSEQFNSWPTVQAITVTANAETAPDGTMTADRISQSASTNATRYLANRRVSYGSQTVTMSVWAGKVSGTDSGGRLVFAFVGDGGIRQYIDPTSTWQRYTYTRTLGSSGSANIGIISEWDINGAANNNVYALWGFQAEVGSFPTSYIPTTSSTATRSADVASMTGTNFSSWYNQSEGTTVSNARTFTPTGTDACIYGYSGAGSSERMEHNAKASYQFLIYDTSGVEYRQDTANYTQDQTSIAAFAYKLNSANSSLNGTLGTEDTSVNLVTPNEINIGARFNSTFPLNGHISRITYYDRRLTDAQLQALTL